MSMHAIWNPWHGCHKCSPGCQNCYMYFLDKSRGVERDPNEVRRTNAMNYPLSKNRQRQFKLQSGERISVNMTSDTFVEEADAWRDEMWSVMRQRPDLIFWMLTKRPERVLDHLPADWQDGYENVMLNVTMENQEMFDKRLPILLQIPAKHKGICIAPIIGPVDVTDALKSGQIEEISVGGENYDNPRACRYEWVESIAMQCRAYHTNFIWYETGTDIWIDGLQVHAPSKKIQQQNAFLSGLSRVYKRPAYKLYSPIDGHLLKENELYQRMYNVHRCMFCSNQYMCNGCASDCGECYKCVRLPQDEFLRVQEQRAKELGWWANSVQYQH